MKIKEILSGFAGRFKNTSKRFTVSLAMSLAFTLYFSYLIIFHNAGGESYQYNILLALLAGCAVSLMIKVISENVYKINEWINAVVSAVLSVGMYFWLEKSDNSLYSEMGFGAVGIIAVIAVMWCLYRNHDERKVFPYLVKSAIYCGILVSVRFLGIFVSLLAFNYLIVEIEDLFDKIVPVLAVFLEFFLCYNLFISYLPQKDDEITSFKGYDLIVSKAGMYVYLLLIAILYGYIVKIIVTWSMPVGRLNWFGCIALLFFVFFYLNVNKDMGPVQKWFVNNCGFVLIPVVAIQLYAIYIRVNAYGLTTLRYASLLLIAVALLFVLNSIIKKKMSWVFVPMAVIALIGLVSPLNIIDLPDHDQEARLKRVLEANGMLNGNEIVNYGKEVSREDAEKICSGIDYFTYQTAGKRNEFRNNVSKLDRYVYDKDITPYDDNREYYNCHLFDETISIEGYKTIEEGYMGSVEEEFMEFFKGFIKDDLDYQQRRETMTFDYDSNTRYIFKSIAITTVDGEIESVSCDYWLLKK